MRLHKLRKGLHDGARRLPYRHLTLDERRALFRLLNAKVPVAEIAHRLGRHRATIHREIGRNLFRDVKEYRDYCVSCDMPLEGGVELRGR